MPNNKGYLTAGRTSETDEYLTPRYVVEPIVKYLKAKGFRTIWCPFDLEHSLYVRVLKENGFKVIHSHISNGKDFFKVDYSSFEFDCIVSNPPFSLKDMVLKHLYEIGKPFAVLLPQNSLQSNYRTRLFIENGLEYLGFDKRACFYTNENLNEVKTGTSFASGYFCWKVLPEKLVFEYLNPVQENYLS